MLPVLLILTALLAPCTAATSNPCAKQLSPCKCELTDGKFIDLCPLCNKTAPTFSKKFTFISYEWDPCRSFKCGDKKATAAVCATVESISNSLGQLQTARFQADSNGIYISYKELPTAASRVYLKCSTTPKLEFSAKGIVWTNGPYVFQLESNAVCPTTEGGTSGSGWSVGDVLLLLFFLSIIIYIVGGVLINLFWRKRSGVDVIPNRQFWTDLPFLVRDGARFLIAKARGQAAGNYQNI